MDFKSFNLNPRIAAGVEAAGFTEPTPIQAQSIPKIMQHCDVMGLAQTGTGKTAAFGLPILHQLMKGKRGHVRALIVAPTRELAEQINEALIQLGKESGLRSVTVYGGVGINPQITKLKRGVEIVVACPGRLLDHIKQGTIDLSKVDVLVLMKRTACSIWAFYRTSVASSNVCRNNVKPCSSRRLCQKRFDTWHKRCLITPRLFRSTQLPHRRL